MTQSKENREKTGKAIRDQDFGQLAELRKAGVLDWSELGSLSITIRYGGEKRSGYLQVMKTLYQWLRADKVVSISVPAYTESTGDYLNKRVITYLADIIDDSEVLAFLRQIRTDYGLNYNCLINRVISEAYSNHGRERFEKVMSILIDWAQVDEYTIDYQTHVKYAYGRSGTEQVTYLKDQADLVHYNFDWPEMAANFTDLRLIVKWAEADNVKLDLDYQELLEQLIPYPIGHHDLLEFYLKRAKKDGKELDFGKLLELAPEEKVAQIKRYCPKGYTMPTYPESFELDLWEYYQEDAELGENDLLSNIVDSLVYYTMKTTEIGYVIHEGKTYYPRDCSVYECPDDSKRADYDPNITCEVHDGYDGDCEAPPKIFPKRGDQLDYHLTYEPKHTEWNDEHYHPKIQPLIRIIQNVSIDKITITGPNHLCLQNQSGINEDHRGSDHCKVKLPFHSTKIVTLPCKLIDFMKACYHLKSHKWDKWYELYGGSSATVDGDIVNISIGFDHGS